MPSPFLVKYLMNRAAENVAQAQQEQAAQLAYQNFVNQETLKQNMAQQQQQQFAQQLTPALTNYAKMLQQSGNEEEAQNVLSGLQALQAGGIPGFEVQQKLKPEKKTTKQKTFGVDREAKSEELYGVGFGELEKEEQTEVNKFVKEEKIEARFPELGLRLLDSYDKEPNVRSFRELKDSVNQMAGVLKGGIERGDFAFADQAAVVMFNKVIDPTSVVREGEFARTTTFMDWISRLKAMSEKVGVGGSLTDKERQELVDTSYDLLTAAHKVTSERTQTFIKRGSKYGLTPEDFDPVGEISLPERPTLPTTKKLTPDQARKNRKK